MRRTPTSILRKIFILVSAIALALPALAVTLSDNTGQTWIDTEFLDATDFVTASFGTDGNAYVLGSVDLALDPAMDVDNIHVDLYSSVGSSPGAPDVNLGALGAVASIGGELYRFDGAGLALSPNSTYWVVASNPTGKQSNWWWTDSNNGNGVGFQGTWGFSDDSGLTWTTFIGEPQVMRVNTVPEPTTLALGALSLTALARRRRGA